ncbi:hypothetical protein FGG08_006984 [Glutinoglossum americanum]|uniref:Uncharacterized protein n=1 Tax=Glutinoglossum americanum TaxID=1670608 RepID=A0A9P8KUE8_9PEZI|nr:hypothetical protein FGG08_006984 [Glutinoglossum americanum]
MRLQIPTLLTLLTTAVPLTLAQSRPNDTTICDFYTTALLKDNTAANQLKLLTLIVNTVVIGNYTTPNVGIAVPGILAPGKFNGTEVNLAPFFDGALFSTNDGKSEGSAVNFLDGGGAKPLMENKAADDDKKDSRQYNLLTHLYEFFGSLLGCSQQGMDDYPAYNGVASMYEVHKFMNLDAFQIGYFIQQVALSAASFGVAKEDLEVVGAALDKLFNKRCSPATVVIPSAGPQLESMCIASSCPLDPMAACGLYDKEGTGTPPKVANASLAGNTSSTASASATGTASATASKPTTTTPTGGAAVERVGSFAAVAGAVLLAFAL